MGAASPASGRPCRGYRRVWDVARGGCVGGALSFCVVGLYSWSSKPLPDGSSYCWKLPGAGKEQSLIHSKVDSHARSFHTALDGLSSARPALTRP